ncbi:MAG: hypothetical protein H7A43_00735 [Verrucomicrobia bacterium]|nr:hypothetical protein [Kiritimatiellia bacterium]MCP5487154.1 hypothetical protein [Verrucomicrobiota bacterium]
MTHKPNPQSSPEAHRRPGWFRRWMDRVDRSLKQKADEKAAKGTCCSGKDGGGSCC